MTATAELTPQPCWWSSDTFARRCHGTALYPPAGWSGKTLIRCDNWEPHEAIVSDQPITRTNPDDVTPMTEAERRLLTELLLDDDREAGVL